MSESKTDFSSYWQQMQHLGFLHYETKESIAINASEPIILNFKIGTFTKCLTIFKC